MAQITKQNLHLLPIPQSPSAAVIVMFRIGSRFEAPEYNGISHFLEHMVFKGTHNRPTALDITSVVDGIGGDFNAFTSKEFTGFYIKSAAKDLPLTIEVLSDMLFNSKFEQSEVDRERGVILEEMNMYHDTPSDRVGEIIDHVLYPDQSLGWDIIGTKKSLANIQREQLLQFNEEWYTPANMVVGVAGGFDSNTIESVVDQAFFSRASGATSKAASVTIEQSKPQIISIQKESDQTHMVLASRSFSLGDQRRYALALLNVILGGNMSSRLFTQVRELRGLAYAIHTHPDHNMDVGAFKCQVGLDHGRINEAIRVILDEYAKVRDQGISSDELARAKNYLRGRLALSLEDPLGLGMYTVRQQLLLGFVDTVDKYMQAIDAVTAQEVQQVAADIFDEAGLNLAIIGPKLDLPRIESELHF